MKQYYSIAWADSEVPDVVATETLADEIALADLVASLGLQRRPISRHQAISIAQYHGIHITTPWKLDEETTLPF